MFCGISDILEISNQIASDIIGKQAAAFCIVAKLRLVNGSDAEMARCWVSEHQSGNGGVGLHHAVLREGNAYALQGEDFGEVEDETLVGHGGVADGGPAPLVFLREKFLTGETLAGGISPKRLPHLLMEPLSRRFGQTVGERLHQQAFEVVMVIKVFHGDFGGSGKKSDDVADGQNVDVSVGGWAVWTDKIGQAEVWGVFLQDLLLAQETQAARCRAIGVCRHHYVVVVAPRWKQSDDAVYAAVF